MVDMVQEVANAFTRRTGGASFQIEGGGTAYGLESLRRGDSDVAMVSWLPPDLTSGWEATRIARDGLVIVVHPDNPVRGLGYLQLQDLYGGRIDTWSGIDGQLALGTVQPVVREEGSGARAAFDELVMEGRRQTPRAVLVTSSSAAVEYVAGDPAAVGYVSLLEVDGNVRVLTLEGVSPDFASVVEGVYPLTRELWLVSHASPSPSVEAFLAFAVSPAGQEIIKKWQGPIQ